MKDKVEEKIDNLVDGIKEARTSNTTKGMKSLLRIAKAFQKAFDNKYVLVQDDINNFRDGMILDVIDFAAGNGDAMDSEFVEDQIAPTFGDMSVVVDNIVGWSKELEKLYYKFANDSKKAISQHVKELKKQGV